MLTLIKTNKDGNEQLLRHIISCWYLVQVFTSKTSYGSQRQGTMVDTDEKNHDKKKINSTDEKS